MRRVLVWCSISTVVVFTILFGYGWVATAQSTGTIKGKVTDNKGQPLNEVVVSIYRREEFTGIIHWQQVLGIYTDATGVYTATNLNDGVYHVGFADNVMRYYYFPEFYNNAATQESATDITMTNGATVNNINAQLSSGAHIKGKVTASNGAPLSDIEVNVFNITTQRSSTFITAGDGLYDIGGLSAGDYRLAFSDRRQPTIYAHEYYNNAKQPESATLITLAFEQTRNNINAQLDYLGVITGKVTNAQNNPLSNRQVIAERHEAGLWYETYYTSTDEAGNYTLAGVNEGVYRVRFRDRIELKYSAEYYNNVVDPTAATPLTVTLNTTITNINAQLALRGGITGRIVNRQGEPVQGVEAAAEFQVTTVPGWYWDVAGSTQSNENGEFTLCCLDAGNYRLRFLDPQNRYVAEYYNDIYYDYYSSLTDVTLVQVTAAMTTTGINAQLSRPSKLVSQVVDQRNQPISNLIVTLYGYNPDSGGQWYNKYANIELVNDTYQIAVAPGRYRIGFEDGRSLARYGAEFYDNAPTIDTATDITVTEETTVTIQATLADRARITGRVTDPNGNPVPDIIVNAYQPFDHPSMPWAVMATTMSDQNGEYSLDGINPGRYRVGFIDTIDLVEFATEYYDDVVTLAAATEISVTENTVVTNIDTQLGRLAVLQGQVTNSDGTALASIEVFLFRYDPLLNQQFTWQQVGFAQTNATGFYQSLLAPGLYRVGFREFSGVYHQTFYNNVGYLENATTITLTTGMTVTGINVQLPTNPFTWPPFAQDDQLIVAEGGATNTLVGGIGSVLANDRTESVALLQANLATQPAHGTLLFNPDGSFTYTHHGNEAASDFFTYSINDGAQQSNGARVAITIQPVNDPPVAGNDNATVGRGQRVTTLDSGAKILLDNDSDLDGSVLTATLKTGPTHGSVTITANGAFTYTHDGSAGSSDSFTYQAADNLGSSSVATVTVAINPFTFSKTVGMAGIKPLCTPVDEIHAPVGTTIVYCYTLRNVGDAPLTTHSLVDSHLGQLLTNHVHAVAPGAIFSVTFTQTLTISTTNIATWTVTSSAEQTLAAPTTNVARTAATVRIASPTDDSDSDNIPDNREKAGDSDGDNIPNFLDTDADGDGKLDKDEVGSNPAQPTDSDQDGIPDYLDSQSEALEQQLFLPVVKR